MSIRAAARKLTLYISNLPWTVSKNEMNEYFSRFGNVASSNVIFNKRTGFSKGYGFVEFKDYQSMNAALGQQSHFLEGSELSVHLSESTSIGGQRRGQRSPQEGATDTDSEPQEQATEETIKVNTLLKE